MFCKRKNKKDMDERVEMRELGRSEKSKAGKKDIMLVSSHGRPWTQQVPGPAGQ